MQNGYVVAFSSRQLKVHEMHYLTHDLDLAVVLSMPKVWTLYLYYTRFEMFNDYKSLKYLFS